LSHSTHPHAPSRPRSFRDCRWALTTSQPLRTAGGARETGDQRRRRCTSGAVFLVATKSRAKRPTGNSTLLCNPHYTCMLAAVKTIGRTARCVEMHRDPLSPPSNARVALSTGADGGCESIVPTLHLCGVLGLKQELSAAEGERYAVRPGIGHAEGGGAADAHLPSRRTVAPLTVPLDAMRSEHNPAPSPVFEDGRTDRLLRQPTLQQRHNWPARSGGRITR